MEGRTNWRRRHQDSKKKNYKKEKNSKSKSAFNRKLYEIQKTKEGLSTSFLLKSLKYLPNFLGVIPQDFLPMLNIKSMPASFIVNLDFSNKSGSHWIAFGVFHNHLEIYDSLGLRAKDKPVFILSFLKRFSMTHRIVCTPLLQNPKATTCGLYCIYFLRFRRMYSLKKCLSIFCSDHSLNDRIIFDKLL